MNHVSHSYTEAPMPTAIYVWLVRSEEVLDQPGSWRIRKWDIEPFPEANFELSQPRGPSGGDLLKLYRETRLRLFGFYDDCDAEHQATLKAMEHNMRHAATHDGGKDGI